MIDVYAALQRVIELGHQGENLHTRVVFDVSQYLMKYPDATFILLHRQPDTEAAYPVLDVSRNGEFLYWRVTSGDLTRAGNGRCELLVMQDNVICKSDIYKTCIQMALDGSGTAPEPWLSWQMLMEGMRDDANEAAERADYAALRAETAAEAMAGADEMVRRAETAAQAVFDMGAEAETLQPGAEATVTKRVDAETGAVTLRFGIPAAGYTFTDDGDGHITIGEAGRDG